MKANRQHLQTHLEQLVNCYWVRSPEFGFHWHYHPEYEITYVCKGHGSRMVGDHVDYFTEGDFVLLGSNLPHTWISDDDFNRKNELMEVIVLQFSPTLFSDQWTNTAEMQQINRALKASNRGLFFRLEENPWLDTSMKELVKLSGIHRLSKTIELLHNLGETEMLNRLTSRAYTPPTGKASEERIMKVCQHIHSYFSSEIKLTTLAEIAIMNPSALSRFFKKSTGQTISEYINDLRVGKACNLLVDKPDLNISQVCYESGFNSQTFFNRIFLRKKKMTPKQFRNITSIK